jgi:hypothetical protein
VNSRATSSSDRRRATTSDGNFALANAIANSPGRDRDQKQDARHGVDVEHTRDQERYHGRSQAEERAGELIVAAGWRR